jgi:hypothetical protein
MLRNGQLALLHMLFVVSEQGTVAPAAIFPILRRLQRSHLDLPGGKVNQVLKISWRVDRQEVSSFAVVCVSCRPSGGHA